MSSVLSSPKVKTPVLPKQQAPVEEIETVVEDEEDVRQREKKKIISTGRRRTILSGIASALKKRLGA